MRRLLLVLCVILAACSSADLANVGEQVDAVTADYSVVNTSQNVNGSATKFCHPIYFGGQNAHAQARTMTWGIPATGALFAQSRQTNSTDSISAFPDTTGWNQVPAGVVQAIYECHNYADFHGTGWTGQTDNSMNFYLSWTDSGTTAPVAVSAPGTNPAVTLWGGDAACWIDGVSHMNWGTKWVSLVGVSSGSPVGWSWQLRASGYAALRVDARCASWGRTFAHTGQSHATIGNSVTVAGATGANSTCFIQGFKGDLDNGAVYWNKNGANWNLSVSGGVSEADGYCVMY